MISGQKTSTGPAMTISKRLPYDCTPLNRFQPQAYGSHLRQKSPGRTTRQPGQTGGPINARAAPCERPPRYADRPGRITTRTYAL